MTTHLSCLSVSVVSSIVWPRRDHYVTRPSLSFCRIHDNSPQLFVCFCRFQYCLTSSWPLRDTTITLFLSYPWQLTSAVCLFLSFPVLFDLVVTITWHDHHSLSVVSMTTHLSCLSVSVVSSTVWPHRDRYETRPSLSFLGYPKPTLPGPAKYYTVLQYTLNYLNKFNVENSHMKINNILSLND